MDLYKHTSLMLDGNSSTREMNRRSGSQELRRGLIAPMSQCGETTSCDELLYGRESFI